MDSVNLKLFNSNTDEIVLPNVSPETVEEQKQLMSQSIEKEIGGKQVKKIILPEDSVIEHSNFLFDFSEVESISIFQKEAIKGLISKNGDTALYLYKPSSLVRFGWGDRYTLERLVPILREQVFGNEIRVFKDFQEGQPIIEVSKKDITKLRINL